MTEQNLTKDQKSPTIRRLVYDLLFNKENPEGFHQLFERAIAFVIIVNLAALLAETIPILYDSRERQFHLFDAVSVFIFTIEYLLRYIFQSIWLYNRLNASLFLPPIYF